MGQAPTALTRSTSTFAEEELILSPRGAQDPRYKMGRVVCANCGRACMIAQKTVVCNCAAVRAHFRRLEAQPPLVHADGATTRTWHGELSRQDKPKPKPPRSTSFWSARATAKPARAASPQRQAKPAPSARVPQPAPLRRCVSNGCVRASRGVAGLQESGSDEAITVLFRASAQPLLQQQPASQKPQPAQSGCAAADAPPHPLHPRRQVHMYPQQRVPGAGAGDAPSSGSTSASGSASGSAASSGRTPSPFAPARAPIPMHAASREQSPHLRPLSGPGAAGAGTQACAKKLAPPQHEQQLHQYPAEGDVGVMRSLGLQEPPPPPRTLSYCSGECFLSHCVALRTTLHCSEHDCDLV